MNISQSQIGVPVTTNDVLKCHKLTHISIGSVIWAPVLKNDISMKIQNREVYVYVILIYRIFWGWHAKATEK